MNQYRYIKLLMAIVLLLPLGSFAQENSLSLEQAIKIGLENNFKIRLTKHEQSIAQNNNSWGKAGLYPNFSLNAGNNFSYSDTYSASSPQALGNSQPNALTGSIQMNWTLFNGFAVHINKANLEQLDLLSQGNAELIIENNLQAIILAYYNVLVQQEKLKVFDQVKNLSQDRYNFQMDQKDLGVSVSYDVLQSKDAYLADSSNYLNQQLNLRKAKQYLNILLGNEPTATYTLTDELKTNFPTFDAPEILNTAQKSNKGLINQYTNLKLMQLATKGAKANMYPKLSVSSGVGHNFNNQNFLMSDQTFSQGYNYYVNFSLSFNLFNGGNTRRAIENARINEDIAVLKVEELKYEITSETYTQLDLYKIRKALVETSQLSMETADMNLSMSKELYQNGSINSFNFRDVQLSYLNASLNKLQAIYNAIETQLQILRLSGNVISYNN